MHEEELYEKMDAWFETPLSTWNHITFLAYFLKLYQEQNEVRFRLTRSKKGVAMTKEAKDFSKLFKTFAPEDYDRLDKSVKDKIRADVNLKMKNFINWVFFYKYRNQPAQINSTSIFTALNVINAFERAYVQYLKKAQSENKLETLLSWCQNYAPEVLEKHQIERAEDLQYIKRYSESYQMSEQEPEVKMLKKAKELGLL